MENNNIASSDSGKVTESVSPYEIKNRLIDMARTDVRKSTYTMLNAGIGNPNWVATTPRDAFLLLSRFALDESESGGDQATGIGSLPKMQGIANRLRDFLNENKYRPGASLLADTLSYMCGRQDVDADELVHEWTDGVLGDHYPIPDRILKYTEMLVGECLSRTIMGGNAAAGYKLFATEGATAGMCYVFDTLQENCLLRSGDGIALMTPIFTPYLEIPVMSRFDFEVFRIKADRMGDDGFHTWQYPDSEIEQLRNPNIKLLCLVNPGNPTSCALSQHTIDLIVDIVKNDNPGLMIITDNSYATFVPGFKSLMHYLPKNTISLYSFSKAFGATGWRTAVVAVANKNIFDYLIGRLPSRERAELQRRYSRVSSDPDKLKFIDRMVADSRMVALNDTAGLSTPAQIQMALFAAYALSADGKTFRDKIIETIHHRLDTLWQGLGIVPDHDPLQAGYYSEIDLAVLAEKLYGADFAEYLRSHRSPQDFVISLAKQTGVVVLNGNSFGAPDWSVRVSLANLDDTDYIKVGEAISKLLDLYHRDYRQA